MAKNPFNHWRFNNACLVAPGGFFATSQNSFSTAYNILIRKMLVSSFCIDATNKAINFICSGNIQTSGGIVDNQYSDPSGGWTNNSGQQVQSNAITDINYSNSDGSSSKLYEYNPEGFFLQFNNYIFTQTVYLYAAAAANVFLNTSIDIWFE